MNKLLRWTSYVFVAFSGLILIGVAALWLVSTAKLHASVDPKPEHLGQPTAAQLADAERQARVLGCFGCHGEGLKGNKMFDDPKVAILWAPNLTRLAAQATDEQLARAIRQGIGVDGRSLFVMQSEVYQHLSDQELAALIQMIRRLPQQGSPTPHNYYGPLGRLGIALEKFKTAPQRVAEYATAEPIRLGSDYESGHRIAMLNCSGCHGARLEGREASPGEMAPDLSIVGAYDQGAFKRLLRTGKPAGGQTLKLMASVARGDLSHMTDSEIEQLYGYLHARAERVGG